MKIKIALFLLCLVALIDVIKAEYSPDLKMVKIADNLYCDKTEVTNKDWREYVAWTRNTFGKDSPEHIASLPDTLHLHSVQYCEPLMSYYYSHIAYSNCPVVGITQQQAVAYSKWLTDRTLEKLLIENGNIADEKMIPAFTIEKYFSGELDCIITGEKILEYPDFRLPTLMEREIILQFADSVILAYLKKCKSRSCKECSGRYPLPLYESVPSGIAFPVSSDCVSPKYPIHFLRGNVSEWVIEPTISVGGGYDDTDERILQSDIFHTETANKKTGFRNVMSWKKWEKK